MIGSFVRVMNRLPLDSPLWNELSDFYRPSRAASLLREIARTGQLGEAWDVLKNELLHAETVCALTSAAIPHLVDLAPQLPATARQAVWIEIGVMVELGAGRFPDDPATPLPLGLHEGLSDALRAAQALAVSDLLTAAGASAAQTAMDLSLACIALAGRRDDRAILSAPRPGTGYAYLRCPECDEDVEVDGFCDSLMPPCPAPAFDRSAEAAPGPADPAVWRDVIEAIERVRRERVLPGWEEYLDTALRVARAGIPTDAPRAAVWCLVSAMMVAAAPGSVSWARALTRLVGRMCCEGCDNVWTVADILAGSGDDARPGAAIDGPEDPFVGPFGFRPSPWRVLRTAQLRRARTRAHTRWRARVGPVHALTAVVGRPGLVAIGTATSATVWDTVSGKKVSPSFPGHATALASLSLSDGRAVLVAGSDTGILRWWDLSHGRQLDQVRGVRTAPVLSLAAVTMAAQGPLGEPSWLATRRDGRTLVVSGHDDGSLWLWDPATDCRRRHEIFGGDGRPVVCLTAIDLRGRSSGEGTDLLVMHGDIGVDQWFSSSGKLAGGVLLQVGQDAVRAAVWDRPPRLLGYDAPVTALATRDGRLSLLTTLGFRVNDQLPPDPRHREITGIVTMPGPSDGVTVVTASEADHTLRAWHTSTDDVTTLPLGVRPRCLALIGDTLLVGHDKGVLALSDARTLFDVD
jgi:WD40 repeat protein